MTDQTARRILTLVHQPNAGPGLFQPIIEEQGFELEIASWAMGLPPSRDIVDYDAVIILGGDMQVDQEHLLPWLAPEKAEIKRAIDAGTPILGICLGGQLIADVEGARVGPVRTVREGWNDVIAMPDAHEDPIMGRLPSQFRTIVWTASHRLSSQATLSASSSISAAIPATPITHGLASTCSAARCSGSGTTPQRMASPVAKTHR